jgi:excisionase family DNA binding protein
MSTALRKFKTELTGREALRREKQRLESEPKKVKRQQLMASVADTGSKLLVSAPVVASPYMTTVEAAQYLKLSRQFLEGARWRDDGSGPSYIQLGRAVRYNRATLDAWMAANVYPAERARANTK